MGSDMSYREYARLTQSTNLRDNFSTHQWVCLNKLVSGKDISSSDLRVLKMSGLLDHKGEPTLIGRVCISKLDKKRHKIKKTKITRKKEQWETQNPT